MTTLLRKNVVSLYAGQNANRVLYVDSAHDGRNGEHVGGKLPLRLPIARSHF
jgi:hypothetical protein